MTTTLGQRVREALEATVADLAGSRGVVGYSGGPDSLCLLCLLAEVAPARDFEIQALHVDHCLRAGSAADAEAACRLAEQLGVPCTVVAPSRGPSPGENVQTWAREQRLEALAEAARSGGAGWAAVGHTADDQAETVLMRAIRGAGPGGLAAMSASRPLGEGLQLVRPLLTITRGEVESHLAEAGLVALQDPSNASPVYLRNRIRQGLVPLLAQHNPSIVETLGSLAASCREEHEVVVASAARARQQAGGPNGALDVGVLAALPAGVLHEVLRQELAAVAPLAQVERRHLLAVARLAAAPSAGTKRLSLPGATAVRRYDVLAFEACDGRATTPTGSFEPFSLDEPGRYWLGQGRWLEASWVEPGARQGDRALLSAARVALPVLIRPPRPGDRIRLTSEQHKKVSRLLIDNKVPRDQRATVPLVTRDEEVLLVVGVRRAEGLGPAPDERALSVTIREP